jgi:hypothetical protein
MQGTSRDDDITDEELSHLFLSMEGKAFQYVGRFSSFLFSRRAVVQYTEKDSLLIVLPAP